MCGCMSHTQRHAKQTPNNLSRLGFTQLTWPGVLLQEQDVLQFHKYVNRYLGAFDYVKCSTSKVSFLQLITAFLLESISPAMQPCTPVTFGWLRCGEVRVHSPQSPVDRHHSHSHSQRESPTAMSTTCMAMECNRQPEDPEKSCTALMQGEHED